MRLFLIEYTRSKEHGVHDNWKQPLAMFVVGLAAPVMTVDRRSQMRYIPFCRQIKQEIHQKLLILPRLFTS